MVSCFPLLGLTPSGLFMGLSSTIINTSELILCSTIYILVSRQLDFETCCLYSARRHSVVVQRWLVLSTEQIWPYLHYRLRSVGLFSPDLCTLISVNATRAVWTRKGCFFPSQLIGCSVKSPLYRNLEYIEKGRVFINKIISS